MSAHISSYGPPKCSSDGSSFSSYGFNSSAEYESGPVVGGSPGPRPNHPGYDRAQATQLRAIHGILAATAVAALFPSGAILVRLIPGRAGFWVHSLMQMLSLTVLASAVAMGVYLIQLMRGQTGVDLVSACPLVVPPPCSFVLVLGVCLVFADAVCKMVDPKMNFHFIVGLIVFVALIFQPALGAIHHERFRRLRRRQYWTYIHLSNGRFFLMAGIVNGPLGLWVTGNWTLLRVGYLAAAGTIWGLWFLVALWKEIVICGESGPPWINYDSEGGLPC